MIRAELHWPFRGRLDDGVGVGRHAHVLADNLVEIDDAIRIGGSGFHPANCGLLLPLVLGGQVNGGRVIANWPGLQNEQLYDRADLAVTTDYRQVLSEIVVRRLGNARLGVVFPGYKDYQPLGIVRGTDLQLEA